MLEVEDILPPPLPVAATTSNTRASLWNATSALFTMAQYSSQPQSVLIQGAAHSGRQPGATATSTLLHCTHSTLYGSLDHNHDGNHWFTHHLWFQHRTHIVHPYLHRGTAWQHRLSGHNRPSLSHPPTIDQRRRTIIPARRLHMESIQPALLRLGDRKVVGGGFAM